MATYVPPKKNVEYIFYIGLVSQANTKTLQSNPTIAAGDFKVSTDGGALANLGTLPAVTPASSKMVKVTLSAAEMNGDNITVVCSDASGAEWCDLIINFQTAANQVDDLAAALTAIDNFIDTEIADIQARLPAALVGGRIDASVGAIAAGVLPIKKNAAFNNFEFLMINSNDHVSPKTGLTVTAERSIDGGAFAACTNAPSEIGNGVYKIDLSASDLNGDVITLKFTGTGADQTTITFLTRA